MRLLLASGADVNAKGYVSTCECTVSVSVFVCIVFYCIGAMCKVIVICIMCFSYCCHCHCMRITVMVWCGGWGGVCVDWISPTYVCLCDWTSRSSETVAG